MLKKLNLYTLLTYIVYPVFYMGALIFIFSTCNKSMSKRSGTIINEVFNIKGDSLIYIPFNIEYAAGDF